MTVKSIVIVDTYYPRFLEATDLSSREFESPDFNTLRSRLMLQRFGTSDAYSNGLRKIGWDAQELVANCADLQEQWASERGLSCWPWLDRFPPSYISRVPLVRSAYRAMPTLHRLLERQVAEVRPDVLYFQDLNFCPPSTLKKLRKYTSLVVGQIASPLPPINVLKSYDLILSSLPNLIDEIRLTEIKSEFLPIAFDSRVVSEVDKPAKDIPASFVGGISRYHNTTIPLLAAVELRVPEIQLFGYGSSALNNQPHLMKKHMGECWGLEMYKTLARSIVTLNRHISIAGDYANNMRLFESTGMGTLLITDYKKNLSEYFIDGKEILTYKTFDEAAELTRWALDNRAEVAKIAAAGQTRTLLSHTYDQCMVRLDQILTNYI